MHVLTINRRSMPEVFRSHGFVFFFYANEGNEPMHVHVRKAGGFSKFWLESVELDYAQGMKITELALAEELIHKNIETIRGKWHEIHGA